VVTKAGLHVNRLETYTESYGTIFWNLRGECSNSKRTEDVQKSATGQHSLHLALFTGVFFSKVAAAPLDVS
jgi:hypothetical protein